MNIPHLRAGASLILAAFCGLAQADIVFAVNEGVTYRVPTSEIRARYAAIAADLGKLLKQPVQIEPVADYPSLRKGLADKAYDLALVHPAHLSIEAIKKSDYKLLVVTKGFQEYKASFLVSADSPLKSLADLKAASWGRRTRTRSRPGWCARRCATWPATPSRCPTSTPATRTRCPSSSKTA